MFVGSQSNEVSKPGGTLQEKMVSISYSPFQMPWPQFRMEVCGTDGRRVGMPFCSMCLITVQGIANNSDKQNQG